MAESKEQKEQNMPMSNVVRIMRRALPADAKISDDAKETMQDCVSEFISFITDEANDRCKSEQRKTVTPEDVICALGNLGYDDYVQPLSLYLQRYREIAGVPAYVRRRNPGFLNVMPPPPPPPQPQPQPPPGFYGYYGYGGPMLEVDPSQQTLTHASASVSAVASASASASGSGSSVATFDSLPDDHLKGDPK